MRSWLVILSLFIAFPGLAEEMTAEVPSDQALTGRFVQERHLSGFDVPIKSEGRFVIVPQRGLLWRTEKPFETALTITPQGILQTVAGQETLRLPASRFPAMGTLREILESSLSGNLTVLEERFGTKPVYQGGEWSLDIEPDQVAGELPLRKIRLEGSVFVDRVELQRNGGDFDVISFSGQKKKALSELKDDEIPEIKGGS
jgi:hypothetical protein